MAQHFYKWRKWRKKVGILNQNRANLTDRLCDLISQGLTNREIVHTLDIAPRTFYRWLARGMCEDGGFYSEFADAVRGAKEDYENSVIRVISEGIENRSNHKEISAVLGITPRTFCNWLARGNARNSGFYHRIVKKIERVKTERYERIMKEALTSPRHQERLEWLGKAEPKTMVRVVPK